MKKIVQIWHRVSEGRGFVNFALYPVELKFKKEKKQ